MVLGARLAGRLVIPPLAPVSQPLHEHSLGFPNDLSLHGGFSSVSEVPTRTRGHYIGVKHHMTANLLANTATAHVQTQHLPTFWKPCFSSVVCYRCVPVKCIHHDGRFPLLPTAHNTALSCMVPVVHCINVS